MPGIRSLDRALDILEAFTPRNHELGITELSRLVRLPPPTVSRLVQTLLARGYLVQNPVTRKYRLGYKFFNFVGAIQGSTSLFALAIPVLGGLRDALEETVYLDVLDGEERVCVLSLPGLHPVQTLVPVGQRSPLYAGADSRMLLSSLPDEKIASYLSRVELRKFASRTPATPEAIWEEVRWTREMGVAVSANEYHEGSACISAPVRDYTGRVVAALSVSFSVFRVSRENVARYARAVERAARELSCSLGYVPGEGPRGERWEEEVVKKMLGMVGESGKK